MKITLKNIGKIETASVEINGITVITGENNTGKSTVGRSIFAIFNSFCDFQNKVENERIKSICTILEIMHVNGSLKFVNTNEVAKTICTNIDSYRKAELDDMKKSIMNVLVQYYGREIETVEKKSIAKTLSQIRDVLNISGMDFLKSVLERKLGAEFHGQVCNLYSGDAGEIQLQIKNQHIRVSVGKEVDVDIQNPDDISLHTEAFYIDDPFVLDDPVIFDLHIPDIYADHKYHLRKKLLVPDSEVHVIDDSTDKENLASLYHRISSVCSGDVLWSNQSTPGYRNTGSDNILNVQNLSAGLKTFVILKMLITRGALKQNGILICDEPERHLHPKWQLLFAELLVLLQKELGVHVLLNTHSPYFLNAIEVYTVKYGVDDKCKYYVASSNDETSHIEDVTDRINVMYSEFARTLQDLENERGQL